MLGSCFGRKLEAEMHTVKARGQEPERMRMSISGHARSRHPLEKGVVGEIRQMDLKQTCRRMGYLADAVAAAEGEAEADLRRLKHGHQAKAEAAAPGKKFLRHKRFRSSAVSAAQEALELTLCPGRDLRKRSSAYRHRATGHCCHQNRARPIRARSSVSAFALFDRCNTS